MRALLGYPSALITSFPWNLRMKMFGKLLLLAFVAGPAFALNPGEKVDNFRLLDADGKSHELYYLSDMKAVVLMVQGNGCPIVRQAVPALRAVRDEYRSRGVEFLLINSNLQDKSDA